MSQAPSVHKPRRSTDEEEARQVLREGKIGVLSLASPQGEPYGVPLNYVYDGEENALYCHCFVRGRKLEFLAANPRVSFVVAVDVEAAPSRFITHYRSALCTGIGEVLTDGEEKRRRLRQLCAAQAPGERRTEEVIRRYLSAVSILRIRITSISGKRNEDE